MTKNEFIIIVKTLKDSFNRSLELEESLKKFGIEVDNFNDVLFKNLEHLIETSFCDFASSIIIDYCYNYSNDSIFIIEDDIKVEINTEEDLWDIVNSNFWVDVSYIPPEDNSINLLTTDCLGHYEVSNYDYSSGSWTNTKISPKKWSRFDKYELQ